MKGKYLFLSLFVLLYFLFLKYLSLWTSPWLNSDHAIHVLMAESFDWSKDWYFWGQNRLGSFIPFLGSFFIALGIPSLSALGIVQSLLLLSSCYLFQRISRDYYSTLIFAALIFFPIYPFWMINSLGHPYLSQFFFILLAFWLFYSARASAVLKASLVPLIFGAALWSSEMSMVIVLAFALVERKKLWALRPYWIYFFASSVLALFLLYQAKINAYWVESYHKLLAGPEDIAKSLSQNFEEMKILLTFQSSKFFNSYLAWTFIVLFGLRVYLYFRDKRKPEGIVSIFSLAALGSWLLVHLSHWNAAMYMPLRYFAPAYLLALMALILSYNQRFSQFSWLRYLPLLMIPLIMNASYRIYRGFDLGLSGRMERNHAEFIIFEALEERGLDSLGIIGSFWNSHLPDALSEQVVAIPRKGDQVRNFRLLPLVKSQKDFIIVANHWLEELPDTLAQYDMTLLKVSDSKSIEEIEYAYYQKLIPPI